jgi:hypothetical protein
MLRISPTQFLSQDMGIKMEQIIGLSKIHGVPLGERLAS